MAASPNGSGCRVNQVYILLCVFLTLYSAHFASAGLLIWRQQSDADNGASAAVEAAEETTTPDAKTLSTIIAPTGPAAATVTAASNITASATSAASAAAASETQLNSLNDPNLCHVNTTVTGEESGINPFCKPTAGQIIFADHEIEVTWDMSLFANNATNIVQLMSVNNTGSRNDEKILLNITADSFDGGLLLKMPTELLSGHSSVNISLWLRSNGIEISANGVEEHNPHGLLYGPMILLESNKNTTSSSSSSSGKKVGEEVGIPVGLVILIVAVIAIAGFLFIRKRRGPGYGGSGARKERIAKVTTPVVGRGHRRDPSFHDEPTRGVELQDRNRGGDDNWDWGSPVSSPTTGGRGSNVFRDEIGRQKGGR